MGESKYEKDEKGKEKEKEREKEEVIIRLNTHETSKTSKRMAAQLLLTTFLLVFSFSFGEEDGKNVLGNLHFFLLVLSCSF